MEATGAGGEALALDLHKADHQVRVINPAAIKAFATSRLAHQNRPR
jgi:transposase